MPSVRRGDAPLKTARRRKLAPPRPAELAAWLAAHAPVATDRPEIEHVVADEETTEGDP